MSDILYYEVLDIPLPELQGLKNLKVAFHHATKDEVRIVCGTNFLFQIVTRLWANLFTLFQVVIHNIRLPKQSTVGDVINLLKTKVWTAFNYHL